MSREKVPWPDDERGPNRDYRMRDHLEIPEEIDDFPHAAGPTRHDRPPVKTPERIAAGPLPTFGPPYDPRLTEHDVHDERIAGLHEPHVGTSGHAVRRPDCTH